MNCDSISAFTWLISRMRLATELRNNNGTLLSVNKGPAILCIYIYITDYVYCSPLFSEKLAQRLCLEASVTPA